MSQSSRLRSKTEIAITSMSVSRHDGATVIVGTEAGVVFQASFGTAAEFEPDRLDAAGIGVDDGKWFDPIKSTFSGHTGRVLDVKVRPQLGQNEPDRAASWFRFLS